MSNGKDPSGFYEILKNHNVTVTKSEQTSADMNESTIPVPSEDRVQQVSQSIGDRTISLSYNSVAFLLLAVIGFCFLTFAFGKKMGESAAVQSKSSIEKPTHEAQSGSSLVSQNSLDGATLKGKAPIVSEKKRISPPDTVREVASLPYSIELIMYPYTTDFDQVEARQLVNILKRSVKEAGMDPAQMFTRTFKRGKRVNLGVYYGRYISRDSHRVITDLRNVKLIKTKGKGSFLFKNTSIVKK